MPVVVPTRLRVHLGGGAEQDVFALGASIDAADVGDLVEGSAWAYANGLRVIPIPGLGARTGTQTSWTVVHKAAFTLGADRVAVDMYTSTTSNTDIKLEVFESDGTTSQGSDEETGGAASPTLTVTGITDTDAVVVISVKANGGSGSWQYEELYVVERILTAGDLP